MEALIVDDSSMMREILSDIMLARGHNVTSCKNAEQALEVCAEKSFPLVLLDWEMPGMSGLELCQRLKSLDNIKHSVIIIVTARDKYKDLLEVLESGADDYVTKPVDPKFIDIRLTIAEKKAEEGLLYKKTAQDLHESREKLIESEKMATLGQLSAGVAHEINNPIGFISSNVSTLSSYMESFERLYEQEKSLLHFFSENVQDLPTQIKDHVKKMNDLISAEDMDYLLKDTHSLIQETQEGSKRISEIVNNLKIFTRLDEAEVKDADINENIESTLNVLSYQLKDKCQVHKDLKTLPKIRCYPVQLNQALMNIIINASQSIEGRGDIHVKTSLKNDDIEILIQDSGCGIAEDVLPKIFDPFFTTKSVGQGTGLGLSVAYGIIQRHGGIIDVSSKIGLGTEFRITLPKRSAL